MTIAFVAGLVVVQLPLSLWEKYAPWIFVGTLLALIAVLIPHADAVVPATVAV